MKTVFYLSLTLAACRLYAQDNPAWRHLPPNAVAIYHLNLAALTAKLSYEVLTAPIPPPQHNTSNRELVAILRDPAHAGIDLSHDLFIVESATTPGETRRLAIRRSFAMLYGYDDSTCIRDSLFRTGFADNADLHAWTTPGQLLRTLLPMATLDIPLPSTPCTHTLTSLRFEKGRILLFSRIPLPPNAAPLYAQLVARPCADTLLSRFPNCSLATNPPPDTPAALINPPDGSTSPYFLPRDIPPPPPFTGEFDCKTLTRCLGDQPLLSTLDKLSFTAGRVTAAGEVENTFELTLIDTRENSLETLYKLLR